MRKYFTITLLLVSNLLFAQTDLLISEYVEGSSNNKAIEIFNGTGAAIDLAAGVYKVEIYFNGAVTATTNILLTGIIQAGDVFVLADNDANSTILGVTDLTSTASFFNGDDAIVLKKGTTILDVIGQVGTDPGTEWGTGLTSTADNTLRRKVGTITGDTNPSDAFDPSIEWDGFAQDTFGGLGDASPLPVELTTFEVGLNKNSAELVWETATEVNNYGFEVERKKLEVNSKNTEWEKIGFVEGHGNSNAPKYYKFEDKTLSSAGKYLYRLKQIDIDGTFEYSEEVELNFGSPEEFSLNQNYPNPFNPTTKIQFTIPTDSKVRLSIFNVLGEQVAELMNNTLSAGIHSVEFNASKLNSGIYFYKIEAGNFVQIRKMMFTK
ncbi:MAG: T9SS type A sorting domain-containing protein [Melioribacteraceae bacterium]